MEVLQRDGFQTYEAGGGYEAIRVARRAPVEFGFFDYVLPDLDGPTAVMRLREETIAFPFVLMSGRYAELVGVAPAGAVAFLPKPLDIAEVRRILREFFDSP